MLTFKITAAGVNLEYKVDKWGNNDWIWGELKDQNNVNLSRVFKFEINDLLNPPSEGEDFENYVCQFQLGTIKNDYVHIPARILGIKNDLMISRDVQLKRSIFVAERNVSVFARLSSLIDHSESIVIGGFEVGAIPWSEFEELLKKFPNTYELNRYAEARVHTNLYQYIDGMKDARGRYESYLKKKTSLTTNKNLDLRVLKKLEIEKYTLIRDMIDDALKNNKEWTEGEWQKLMLDFFDPIIPKVHQGA